jgi:hypothetical protein
MPIEFCRRPLEPESLDLIRQQIESFDEIATSIQRYGASSRETGRIFWRSYHQKMTNEGDQG